MPCLTSIISQRAYVKELKTSKQATDSIAHLMDSRSQSYDFKIYSVVVGRSVFAKSKKIFLFSKRTRLLEALSVFTALAF
jgi:hypothetical protein